MSTPPPVFVPDGLAPSPALARTTTLFVGAHPDDAELLAPSAIGDAGEHDDAWFTVAVCADGAGSPAAVGGAGGTGLVERRIEEQHRAARLGGYAAVVMLGHSSADLQTPRGRDGLTGELRHLLDATHPELVITHSPLDRHPTHVAVARSVITALRSAAGDDLPVRVLGVEGWGSLDWLPPEQVVALDASGHTALADDLARCFESQLAAKRFDRAGAGRRAANATFARPHEPDRASAVTLAFDLTEVARPGGPEPAVWLDDLLDKERERFMAPWRGEDGNEPPGATT
jgi:LmbE family N-acetylglucosaminyl deacetylase